MTRRPWLRRYARKTYARTAAPSPRRTQARGTRGGSALRRQRADGGAGMCAWWIFARAEPQLRPHDLMTMHRRLDRFGSARVPLFRLRSAAYLMSEPAFNRPL